MNCEIASMCNAILTGIATGMVVLIVAAIGTIIYLFVPYKIYQEYRLKYAAVYFLTVLMLSYLMYGALYYGAICQQ